MIMVSPDFSKSKDGLVAAIAQDWRDGQVLMIAWMNEEAWRRTVETGRATYWSRSRNRLWAKGESSGNVQQIKAIYLDCDRDAVLMKVEQIGDAACHEGYRSCFFRRLAEDGGLETVGERVFDPEEVYGGQK